MGSVILNTPVVTAYELLIKKLNELENRIVALEPPVITPTNPPSPVLSLFMTNITQNSAIANWNNPTGGGNQTRTYVYIRDSGTTVQPLNTDAYIDIQGITYEFTGLTSNTNYSVSVFAYGNGLFSDPAQVKFKTSMEDQPPEKPSPLNGLNVDILSNSSVHFTWDTVNDQTVFIYLKEQNTPPNINKDPPQIFINNGDNGATISQLSLQSGRTYYYWAFTQTQGSPPIATSDSVTGSFNFSPPNPVDNLKVMNILGTSAEVSWSNQSTGSTHTRTYVYVQTSDVPPQPKSTDDYINAENTSFTLQNLTADTKYYTYVFAYGNGFSDANFLFFNTLNNAAPPSTPPLETLQGFRAEAEKARVHFYWTSLSNTSLSILIYIQDSDSTPPIPSESNQPDITISGTLNNTILDRDFDNDKTYYCYGFTQNQTDKSLSDYVKISFFIPKPSYSE